MTDSTAAVPEKLPGFGMHGAMPDVMSAVTAKAEGLAEAARVMVVDAVAVPGRVAQAAALLTDNGEIGTIVRVLGAAASWVAAFVLVAVLWRRLARPRRPHARSVFAS